MINENQIVPYSTEELPLAEGPWLVFAPHADDETFGMGGTLAKASAQGITVEVVIMTDGALGGTREGLVEIRKQEAVDAAKILGLGQPVFLTNRDRELRIDEVTRQQVKNEIERVKPGAVFFPGVFELHPDHRTTAALVWQVLSENSFLQVVPFSYEVLVQSPINTLIDISPYISRKKEAMAVYASQLSENRYIDISLAMNRLRTLTLGDETAYAEGFYRYSPEDLKNGLETLFQDRIKRLFEA